MRNLILSLLVLLSASTAWGYHGHSSHHSSHHSSSYHSSYHNSYHPSHHNSSTHSTSHTESKPTYHPVNHVDYKDVHYDSKRLMYYYLMMNNRTHVNDTIKAESRESLENKVVSTSGGDDNTNVLLIISGVGLILILLAVVKGKDLL